MYEFDIGLYEEIYNFIESSGYIIEDAFLSQGVPTFYVDLPENSKEAFMNLLRKLEPYNFIPILRKINGKNVLRIVKEPPVRHIIPKPAFVFAFIATLATIFISGYFPPPIGIGELNIVLALEFVAAMILVLATHEIGHWILARKHGIKASPPLFIPGPPPFGTFGAVIVQSSLAPTKDALFDVGVSGPLFGFIASLIVSFIGLPLSKVIPFTGRGGLPPIFLYSLMAWFIKGPLREGYAVLLHPIAFAGWVGMLITMLNLVPAGTLDGGHVARCFLKPNMQLIAALVGVAILFWRGFYFFAMLALIMAVTYKHPGPLDDISPLSKKKKLLAIVPVVIFLLCVLPF